MRILERMIKEVFNTDVEVTSVLKGTEISFFILNTKEEGVINIFELANIVKKRAYKLGYLITSGAVSENDNNEQNFAILNKQKDYGTMEEIDVSYNDYSEAMAIIQVYTKIKD